MFSWGIQKCPSLKCGFLSSINMQIGLGKENNDPEENQSLEEATLFSLDKLSFPTAGSNYKDMKYKQLELGIFQPRFLKSEA